MREANSSISGKNKDSVRQSVSASGGSTIKNVVQIGGDFEGVLFVGDILVRDVERLSLDYAGRIQNFFDEYLGSPERPIPFGGRQAEMAALDEWLTDPKAPPYALLAADAGRGKSTLLVRWAQTVMAQKMAHVIFIPISIRFNTSLSSVVFIALAARLGEIYDEPIKYVELSADQWREVCLTYLRRPSPDGKLILVILDGLDEAADWQPGPDLFPLSPPKGIRAIVSARYLADDVDARDWLRRLGWEQSGRAHTFSLPPLTEQGVGDVLQAMGNPLDKLAAQVEVISELFRLSAGDPLLVRLYVDAMLPYGEQTAALRFEDLPMIEDGLTGYFKRWWHDQNQLWGEENTSHQHDREIQAVLNLLACALGPLTQNDLLSLAPVDINLNTWGLERVLASLARFVIGDGRQQGYVFSHPRLGYYFYERLSENERRVWEQCFLDLGKDTLTRLNENTLAADSASIYTVEHFGAHLKRSKAASETIFGLVSEGWLRAWQALKGTRSGFINDVDQSWLVAEAEDNLPMQIKCALCHTSLIALSANTSPVLLRLALQHKLMSPFEAFNLVRAVPTDMERGFALATVIPYLPPQLIAEALSLVLDLSPTYAKAWAWKAVSPHVPDGPQKDSMFQELNKFIDDTDFFPSPTTSQIMPFEWHTGNSSQARVSTDEIFFHENLEKAAAELGDSISLDSLPKALELALSIEDEVSCLIVLRKLARYLTPSLASKAFLPIITRFSGVKEHRLAEREEILGLLAATIPSRSLPDLVRQALPLVNRIGDEWQQAVILTNLSKYTGPLSHQDISSKAFAVTNKIANDQDNVVNRAVALAELVPHLSPNVQVRAFANVVQAAWNIEHDERDEYVRILSNLVPYLHPKLLSKAVAIVTGKEGFLTFLHVLWLSARRWLVRHNLIRDLSWQEYVWKQLHRFSKNLPDEPLESWSNSELLNAALATVDEDEGLGPGQRIYEKSVILDDLAGDMPQDIILEALNKAMEIQRFPGFSESFPVERVSIWGLNAMAPKLTQLAQSQPGLVDVQGRELLRFLATRPRPEFLRTLSALIDFYFVRVEDGKKEETAKAISYNIQEVCRWWN